MNELFERELINTTINDESLADYVKENYMPMSVIEDIKHDIENQLFVGRLTNHYEFDEGLKWCLDIIDKHTKGDVE